MLHLSPPVIFIGFLFLTFRDRIIGALRKIFRRPSSAAAAVPSPPGTARAIFAWDYAERLPPRVHLFASGIAVLLILTLLYGRYRATSEVQYLTRVGTRDYAVIRIYGDEIITAPYRLSYPAALRGKPSPPDRTLIERGLRIFKIGDRVSPEDLVPVAQTAPVVVDVPIRNIWWRIFFSEELS